MAKTIRADDDGYVHLPPDALGEKRPYAQYWGLMVGFKGRAFGMLIFALFAALALPSFAAPEILPCAVGNKWEYENVKLLRASVQFQGKAIATMRDASSGTSVYEVASMEPGSSPAAYGYIETTQMRSTKGGESDNDRTELRVTFDESGLRILSTNRESSRDKESEKQTYDPPLLYYVSSAAAAGKSWDVGAMRDGDTRSFISARGAGRETVTVPAGTFKDCLKVIYSSDDVSGTMDMWDKTFAITSGRSRGIYWVAEGVGVVKELEVSTSTAETTGPDGKPVTVEAAVCTVSELKPGYVVNK